ncbi:hypothetical protein PSTEL_03410 [Paenibacillus stellifer]|uniref:Putative amidase domain-containing protein n=1 Tax=Paenibacillus stellifer TaxID=169760 RepID=A0A089N0X1_9BACL|nr:amidase domain-containing protein [Paenibacillus stellifer]AIQ62309.1 hypothetical protein PSTEL_03410 [Paenibacillus stellifer]
MTAIEQNWKRTLYMYVDQCNKSKVAPETEIYTGSLAAAGAGAGQRERGRRLADWYAEREITPRRCETGVKVLSAVARFPGEISAVAELHSAFFYEKGGIVHREDRVERELLAFSYDSDGNWQLHEAERHLPERRSPGQFEGRLPAGMPDYGRDEYRPSLPGPLLSRKVTGISSREIRYRREDAAMYADRWWDGFNPEFETFAVDCTNYVSQCIFAGGAPINYTGKRETGWWYKGYIGGREEWSFSWAVSDSLRRYLDGERRTGLRAEAVESPQQLMLGDVIQYDWDGNGRFQHSTIVTAFDAGGMPLVNAHTVPSRHRYWDYKDSYAWTDRTVYRFFHIYDYL